jgi:hypothetical protein
MAKYLVLRNMANVKIDEIEVSDRPKERELVVVGPTSYRIFRMVSPNLKREDDIVYRAVVTPL